MKVYTSYFANTRKLHEAGIYPIGVALYPPKWFQFPSMRDVAPRRYMLDDSLTEEQYTQMYFKDVLAYVKPEEIIDRARRISQGKDIALLCYEKPGDFCHRHILAEWLSNSLGIEITEFGQSDTPKAPVPEQQSLF